MGLTLPRTKLEPYIPEYLGNRARYEAGLEPAPTIVYLRLPTWREQRAFLAAGSGATPEAFDTFLAQLIGPIENLVLDDGTVVRSGIDLLALGGAIDHDFIQELNVALGSRLVLEAGVAKNCSPRRGSADSPPRPDGTAGTVGDAASTS